MSRSLLRTLTGLVFAGAALVGVGGTAAGVGTGGDELTCSAWHPQIEASVTRHAWNPAPLDVPPPQHAWHPSATASPHHGWHPAAPASPRRHGYHPAAPVAGQHHAWNPVSSVPTTCDIGG